MQIMQFRYIYMGEVLFIINAKMLPANVKDIEYLTFICSFTIIFVHKTYYRLVK